MNLSKPTIKSIFHSLLILCLWGTLPLFANPVNLQILGVSNAAPAPGTSISVTVRFCDDTAWASDRVKLIAGFSPGVVASFSACPSANQYYVVDTLIAGGIATGPGMYDSGNGSTQGGSSPPYYPSYSNNGTPSCPAGSVTAIWSIYIDGSYLNPGTYSLVVGAAEDYVNCTNATAYASTTVNIPLPPAAFAITKSAEGATAAPNGLVLFTVDYTFVNTNNFIISDTVPPGMTFAAISPNGTNTAGALTWTVGNATTTQKGSVWFLASVNPGAADGTVISNTASGQTNEVASANSNAVSTTVAIPHLNLIKSQSSSSLPAGATVTYNLDWTADGKNLQLYDSYDNDSVGTTGNSIQGFDGTSYLNVPGPGGSLGTWTIRANAAGDHFIEATSPYNAGGGGGNYPELIRNVPGLNICSDFIVEGDIQIPVTAAGAGSGADAHMVLAVNPSQGITLKAAISIDNSPGNLFVQKNNIFPLQSGSAAMVFNSPFSIQSGVWYTLKADIQSTGTGTTNFNIVLWPKTNPATAVTLIYSDTFAPQPICSGGWRQGWQADETAGTDWFANLKVFGPGPIVNPSVSDAVPPGITYVGSSVPPFSGPSPLVWNYAATMFSFDTPINWWGTVACPGPISNQYTMSALGIPVTTSNTVNLTLSSCITPTPTPTPIPPGCKVLVYLNVGACDELGGATGGAMVNLIPILQNAGAQVTTIGVCSNSYCPAGDNWSNYNQVWDCRFAGPAELCSGFGFHNDYFAACWQTTATTYLQNGGNLYLQGENAGFPSRYMGNDAFLRSVGAVTGGYTDCPLGATSNDYADLGVNLPSSLLGAAQFFGYAVGGIPTAVSNGQNFVTYTGPWNNSGATNRALATGWTSAQMTLGAGAGKLFTSWDTTMWTGGYYTGGTKTIVDTFYTSVYQWLGGSSCSTPVPTPTSTPTNSPTNSPTPSPTNTPTLSPTPTFTNTPTPGVSFSEVPSSLTAQPGDVITYTITLNITGPSVNGLVITDILPTNVTFVGFGSSPVGTGAGFNPITNSLFWTLPSPISAGTYTLSYQTQVNPGTPNGTLLTDAAQLTYAGIVAPLVTSSTVTVIVLTPTPTSTISPTFTPTPVGLHVWPNPFDPKYAVGGVLKAYQCPPGSVMTFYTVSGELVRSSGEVGGMIPWDGRNNAGAMVSTGTYYYVIKNNDVVLLTGKVLVLISN